MYLVPTLTSILSHGERFYFYGLPKVIEGQVIVQKFSRNKFQTVTFKKRTEELVALLKSQERQRFKSNMRLFMCQHFSKTRPAACLAIVHT